MKSIDEQYKNLLEDVLRNGEWQQNRTGVPTLFKIGAHLSIDCSQSFPLLTTKKVYWKSAFAEMLGFIRGYDNAADFRALGCNVWNKDANENVCWLNSSHRRGKDDLGRIYGVQWRSWEPGIDQLRNVVKDLSLDIDNRREIIIAWNPAELEQMALPPCHFAMTFSLTEERSKVNLSVFQRSWDLALGCPYNITQYAFLLNLIAVITKKRVGVLHFHAVNVHIYENHLEGIQEQLRREPKEQHPKIWIDPDLCDSLDFIDEASRSMDEWVAVYNYDPHPPIKFEMVTETAK